MAVLGIDIDAVLAQFVTRVIEIYNSRYEDKIKEEDFTSYKFSDSFGEERANRIIKIFHEPGFYTSLQPFPNALEVVDELLTKGHTIEICTAPPSSYSPIAVVEKLEWIAKWFPALSKNVTVTKNKFYCKVDMLIDDYSENIEKWCQHHPKGVGFLVNQLWNKDLKEMPYNSVRGTLSNIPDLVDHFYCPVRKIFAYRIPDLKSWCKH